MWRLEKVYSSWIYHQVPNSRVAEQSKKYQMHTEDCGNVDLVKERKKERKKGMSTKDIKSRKTKSKWTEKQKEKKKIKKREKLNNSEDKM